MEFSLIKLLSKKICLCLVTSCAFCFKTKEMAFEISFSLFNFLWVLVPLVPLQALWYFTMAGTPG